MEALLVDVHCLRASKWRQVPIAGEVISRRPKGAASRAHYKAPVFFKARARILAFFSQMLDDRGFSPSKGRQLENCEGARAHTMSILCDRVADPNEDARSFVASSKLPTHRRVTVDVSVQATHKDEGEVGCDSLTRIGGLVVLHVARAV